MKKTIYTLGFVMIIITLVLTSVELLSFNKGYYVKQYRKLEVAQTIGVSDEDLMKATNHLLDYIKGKQDNLDVDVVIDGDVVPMFNQREIDHMVDVQVLMLKVFMIRNILFALSIVLLLGAVVSKDYQDLVLMKASLQQALMVLGLVFGFIGMYAVLDFDAFWIQFHEVLFDNDLWLLDPRTDRLIMMVPQAFFSGLVYRIVAAIAGIILLAVGGVWKLGKVIQDVTYRTL